MVIIVCEGLELFTLSFLTDQCHDHMFEYCNHFGKLYVQVIPLGSFFCKQGFEFCAFLMWIIPGNTEILVL